MYCIGTVQGEPHATLIRTPPGRHGCSISLESRLQPRSRMRRSGLIGPATRSCRGRPRRPPRLRACSTGEPGGGPGRGDPGHPADHRRPSRCQSDDRLQRLLASRSAVRRASPSNSRRPGSWATSAPTRPRAALARGTTGAIGVLLTDALSYAFTDEVSTTFLGAVVDALAPTGMAVTLLTSNDRDDVVPARDVAIDGAIVYSCRPNSVARDWLVRRKLPLVYVDQDLVAGTPSVNVDDRGGARAAAEHLIGLGHREFGILTISAEGAHPEHQRLLGWLDALRAVDLDPAVAHRAATSMTRRSRPLTSSSPETGDRPLSCASPTSLLSARCGPLSGSGSRCRLICRSSASTTARWPGDHTRHSRPYVRT